MLKSNLFKIEFNRIFADYLNNGIIYGFICKVFTIHSNILKFDVAN